MTHSFLERIGVGTKIRTVDFRLNYKTMKTLISQRSRISAGPRTSDQIDAENMKR